MGARGRQVLRVLRLLLACVVLSVSARPAAPARIATDVVVLVAYAASDPARASSPEAGPRAVVATPTAVPHRVVGPPIAERAFGATTVRPFRDVYLLHCSLLC